MKLKKKLINKILLIIYIFSLFFLSSAVYAKGGEDHSWDMLYVLGLSNTNDKNNINIDSFNNFKKLQSMLNCINDSIDYYGIFYKELKSNFPYFTFGNYGHRLIYHWGFDIDKNLSNTQYQNALAKLFNSKIYEYYKWHKKELTNQIWYEEWDKFMSFLQKNQKLKNYKLINNIHENLGLSYSVSEHIAAILHYVHLLGDHEGHSGDFTGEAVLEIEKILENMNIHIKGIIEDNLNLYELYVEKINSINLSNEKEASRNIILCLRYIVPKILKSQFLIEIENKGLVFCSDDEEEIEIAA